MICLSGFELYSRWVPLNDDNVWDIINCAVLYYETGASGNAFLPKEKFRAPVSSQVKTLSLKRNSHVSRPEFKSSRKLKRGLSFNDFIILVIDLLYGNLEYQWPLCPALRSSKDCHFGWRSKHPAWKDVRIWLCYSIQWQVYVFIKETIFSVFTTSVFIYIFNVLHSTQTIGTIGFIAWWKLAAKQSNHRETDTW